MTVVELDTKFRPHSLGCRKEADMKEPIALTIIAVALAIVIMLLGSMALCFRHTEKMAELGYVEVSYPGSSYTHWEKAK